MGIRLLGPLQVDGDGPALGPRDRVVLSALALRQGEAVAPDLLADALWGEDVPATWPKVVQGCIVRLRRKLGPAAVETVGGGYRLAVDEDELDTVRFERLVERGRDLASTGEPDRAAASFTRALGLWRGTAYHDLEQWTLGTAAGRRLDELRRVTEEDLLEARLAVGENREVAAEAEARVAVEPLRERRWAILALAQYRCGRQGAALRSLSTARQSLVDQLGVDPGQGLVDLEAAILRHDAELLATPHAAPVSENCPYPGLVPYGAAEAESFFGRDAEVAACLDRIGRVPVLVVAGPSGCGKSSLLRAGVVPALVRRGRAVAVLTPGVEPERALTAALASTSGTPVLVVDQLEELFPSNAPSETARSFCSRLVAHGQERAPVVVAVRADHLARLAADATFARVVEEGLHLVSPLAGDELRTAIEGPAARAGLRLEHGLVDLLMRDAEGEAGALPMLSHALAETWRRRDGRVLTVEGYRATGGIRGAVALSAERLYEALPPKDRAVVRSLLLRLVAPAPDGYPFPSRTPMRRVAGDADRDRVLDVLVQARLVTTDEDSVELAHEALARAWPRLRSWLDDDAAGQRILRHLAVAADGWESLGRPAGELYRGGRLEAVLEWRAAAAPDLTDAEQAFLDASMAEAASERSALEARARTQARQNRRLRGLLAGAGTLLVVALVAGAVAVGQRDRAQESAADARASATAAEARRLSALSLTVDDLDQGLLLAVEGRRVEDSNGARTNLLAALDRGPEAIGMLRLPAQGLNGGLVITGDGRHLVVGDFTRGLAYYDAGTLERVAVSFDPSTFGTFMAPTPDGHGVLATTYPTDTDGTATGAVQFFDAASGDESRPALDLLPSAPPANAAAMSRDGRYLAVSFFRENDGPAPASQMVWDLLAPGSPPVQFAYGLDNPDMAFAGPHLVIAGAGPQPEAGLVVVDPATGRVISEVPSARGPMDVNPDGAVIAAWSDGAVGLFDSATGERRSSITTNTRPLRLALSPDGRSLATALDDRSIQLWDLATGARTEVLAGHSVPANGLEFGTDSQTLYSSSADGNVIAWDLRGDRRLISQVVPPDRPPDAPEVWVTPSPDGSRLSYLSTDQVGIDHVSVRDLVTGEVTPPWPSGHPVAIWQDWTPDGRRLVTVGNDGAVRSWDPATGASVAERRLPAGSASGSIGERPEGPSLFLGLHDGGVAEVDAETLELVGEPLRFDRYVSNVDVSPDGSLLAVALWQPDAVVLVDARSGETVARLDGIGANVRLEFSPDGSALAAGASDGLMTLIDPETGRISGAPLRGVDGALISLAFSSDGERIVTSGTDGTVQLWNVAAHERIARFTPGSPGHRVFAWFGADDRTVVAADDHGGVWTIPSEPDAWQERACQIAGRNLNHEEWRQLIPDRPYRRTCPQFPAGA